MNRALRYAFLTLLSTGLVAGGWFLARVNVLLAFALVPIAVLALMVAAKLLGLGTVHRTRQEVIIILQSFLNAADSAYDPRWDDFVTVPIHDPELDAVRRRLLRLESTYSRTAPEDFLRTWKEALREVLLELGAAAA